MSQYANLTITQWDDNVVGIQITPPTNIGTYDFRWTMRYRFNGETALIQKYSSSLSGTGGGQSGITVTSSGNGLLTVAISSYDTSGLRPGAYAYDLARTNSGSYADLVHGYVLLFPSFGGIYPNPILASGSMASGVFSG